MYARLRPRYNWITMTFVLIEDIVIKRKMLAVGVQLIGVYDLSTTAGEYAAMGAAELKMLNALGTNIRDWSTPTVFSTRAEGMAYIDAHPELSVTVI